MSKFRRNMMMFTRPVESSITASTISPNAGAILPSQTISISFSEDAIGAEYSFDGETWVTYIAPFTLANDSTVYARATDGDGNYSRVVSNSYTLQDYVRIEYLQSTGTQYIDTGVLFQKGIIVNIDAIYTDKFTTTQILVGPSAGSGCWMGNVNRDSGSFGIGSNANQVIGKSNIRTSMVLSYNASNTTLTGNNVTRTINRSSNPTTSTIKIFSAGSNYYSSAKIYSCSFSLNSVTLANFIPVRVGQVGYMYDTISGNLFGNDGTGDFTLGNDAASSS